MKIIRRVHTICRHSTFVAQFSSFETSRVLYRFNQKRELNVVAVMELMYTDVYTDQYCLHITHRNGKWQ